VTVRGQRVDGGLVRLLLPARLGLLALDLLLTERVDERRAALEVPDSTRGGHSKNLRG
jgi:hypothetical protein